MPEAPDEGTPPAFGRDRIVLRPPPCVNHGTTTQMTLTHADSH